MKKILLMSVLGLLVFGFVFTPKVHADARCSGWPGVQVWQDSNKGGPSMTLCMTSSKRYIKVPKLSDRTDNLSFFANWDNRISSLETFNFGGHTVRLYPEENYSDVGSSKRYVTVSGIEYIPYIGVYWQGQMTDGHSFNDQASSIQTLN